MPRSRRPSTPQAAGCRSTVTWRSRSMRPALGYYASAQRPFGRWPGAGSDFVTAPELTPLFGQALARQVSQALQASDTDSVLEFGAGSGALAETLLGALGTQLRSYRIVELSAALRARQAERLARFGDRVQWLDRMPESVAAVVLGNEVLDAMPVQLLAFDGRDWFERGVALDGQGEFVWSDRPTPLRPPHEGGFAPGSVTEIHLQGQAFVSTARAGAASRRRVLHRLRIPCGRVLPPAARRRHADVPSRAPRRQRAAARRRAQGHHRARRLQRHRAGGAGRRARRAGLHLAGALPAQLRPARADAAGRCRASARWRTS